MQFPSLLGHVEELLGIVQNSHLPADSLIDSFFRTRKYLGARDRRFIAETLYGTLRHLSKCEGLVEETLNGAFDQLSDHDRRVWIVTAYLARLGGAKLDPSEIAEKIQSPQLKDRSAELLRKLHSAVLAVPNAPVDRISFEYSFPRWMVERFIRDLGAEESERLCSSLNEPAPLILRANTLKGSVEECQASLKQEGIETTTTALSPLGLKVPQRKNLFQLETFRKGWFEVQDEGSQILPLFVDPKPNAKVLDACAGAGGKALQLSALMRNRGEIYAADINAFRLDQLKKRSKRAGAFNIRTLGTEQLFDRSEELSGFFDVVLIDAPCTGLGTIRRNPGMKWSVTEQSVGELAAKQMEIILSHAEFVKPGGLLFYATCSVLREENEDVVAGFLDKKKDFEMIDAASHAERSSLVELVQKGFLRLWPQRHRTDGFFCAVLQRKKS